jgi:hypothetical protein
LTNLAADWDLLQSLAQKSKGQLFSAEEAGKIVERLGRQVQRKVLREEGKPWHDEPLVWWVLGVLLALLTLEWSWRKWLDLP